MENSAAERIAEEALYEQAMQEIASGTRREGLWAKANRESGGSQERAESIYIKLLVQALKDKEALRAKVRRRHGLAEPADAGTAVRLEEDEGLYKQASDEIAQGTYKKGLWVKALSEADGSEERQGTLYQAARTITERQGNLESRTASNNERRCRRKSRKAVSF